MANAYGTDEYRLYINNYLAGLTFKKTGEEIITFGNLTAKLEFFVCDFKESGDDCHAERTDMTITDINGVDHVYQCIDAFMYPCAFNYNGSMYLVFRKSLYGYTILNLTDFSEINYFPSEVIDGKEAFIMCEAKGFNDLLILFGCFWAGPYTCYALDLETFNTVNLCTELGMEDVADNGVSVSSNVLTLVDGNTGKTFTVGYDELKTLIAENPAGV